MIKVTNRRSVQKKRSDVMLEEEKKVMAHLQKGTDLHLFCSVAVTVFRIVCLGHLDLEHWAVYLGPKSKAGYLGWEFLNDAVICALDLYNKITKRIGC